MNQNLKKKGVRKMGKNRSFHHHEGHCCGKENEDCGCNNAGKDCNCGEHFHRRFQTKEEERSTLEAYLADLKLEVQAVEERLVNLKK
jgi:hypothetical protein